MAPSREPSDLRGVSMRRALFRVLAAVVVLVPALVAVTPARDAVASSAEPPNIILITTDDQSLNDLKYMPYTLELLGGGGVTFTDAISPYPLCCPARATILTGQQAHNHKVLS